jgi:predicted transcriptional regulator
MSLAANKCSIFSKEFCMTKQEEREEARRLRRQGMSINKIAKKLGISLSSASTWCRDIPLTEEQEEALRFSNERYEAQAKGAKANVDIHREKRRLYQEEGRQKAREGDALHLAGCMLYWAEGSKDRNSIKFVNSDPSMMIVFVRFLREVFNIQDKQIKFRIVAYLDNGITVDEIKTFWLETLALDWTNLTKSRFGVQPKSSQQKGRKLIYGVCELYVGGTNLIQHIYGAIQEYSGIDKPEWLDC